MATLFCPYCGTRKIYTIRAKALVCRSCRTKIVLNKKDGQIVLSAANSKDVIENIKLPATMPAVFAPLPVPALTPVFEVEKRIGPTDTERQLQHFIVFSKKVVSVTAVAVGLALVIASIFVLDYIKEIRLDAEKSIASQLHIAREEASQQAIQEAQTRLEKAFLEDNVTALVEAAAIKTAGQTTERKVNNAVGEAMDKVGDELSALGKIADAGSRLRIGLRAGLDDLVSIQKMSTNEVVKARADNLLKAIAKDYEQAAVVSMKGRNATNVVEFLRQLSDMPRDMDLNVKTNLVQSIHTELDMGCVALAFLALREKTGVPFDVFDFEAVEKWMRENPEVVTK